MVAFDEKAHVERLNFSPTTPKENLCGFKNIVAVLADLRIAARAEDNGCILLFAVKDDDSANGAENHDVRLAAVIYSRWRVSSEPEFHLASYALIDGPFLNSTNTAEIDAVLSFVDEFKARFHDSKAPPTIPTVCYYKDLAPNTADMQERDAARVLSRLISYPLDQCVVSSEFRALFD